MMIVAHRGGKLSRIQETTRPGRKIGVEAIEAPCSAATKNKGERNGLGRMSTIDARTTTDYQKRSDSAGTGKPVAREREIARKKMRF